MKAIINEELISNQLYSTFLNHQNQIERNLHIRIDTADLAEKIAQKYDDNTINEFNKTFYNESLYAVRAMFHTYDLNKNSIHIGYTHYVFHEKVDDSMIIESHYIIEFQKDDLEYTFVEKHPFTITLF